MKPIKLELDAVEAMRLIHLIRQELYRVSENYRNDPDIGRPLISAIYRGDHKNLRALMEILETPLLERGYLEVPMYEGTVGNTREPGHTPLWVSMIRYKDGSIGGEAFFNPNVAYSVFATVMNQGGVAQGQMKRIIWEQLPNIPDDGGD